MTTIFYSLFIIFIWSEFFLIKNKIRLDTNFRNRDIKAITKLDVFFYFIRLVYWICLFIGIFSSFQSLFITILILKLIKLPLYHINRKWYIYWDNFLPLISSFLLLVILFAKIIG
jgi:hypothetical protein